MFENRTLKRLNKMLDEALAGNFRESNYDESKLSRLESKWKHYLWTSVLTKENLEKEKGKIKSLVSDISHQTKTPLTNIKLYISLLKENLEIGEECGNREENLQMIYEIMRQTEKLEFLIHSLTKMSRLETNIVELKPRMEQVGKLLEEAVSAVALKAKQKEVEINNTYEEQGTAYFDQKWTKEALVNILDNAVKYSHAGGRVILSVKEYEIYTAIVVKDEGIGIKEEDLPEIFGRFYRAEEVSQKDGVGIGLYLAREILRKEDGYIKVKSQLGKGSEFFIYLSRNLS